MKTLILYRKKFSSRLGKTETDFSGFKITDYCIIRALECPDKDKAFWEMQGENWSPNGEALELIRSAGTDHTSMSVGDCLIDLGTGELWMCMSFGWELIPRNCI